MYISDLPSLAPATNAEIAFDVGSTFKCTLNELRDFMSEYKPGESFTASDMIMNGLITSSTKKLMFDLALPKSVRVVTSASVTDMTGTLRGPAGYLNSDNSNVDCVSNYTVTVTGISSGTNHITINVSSGTAFTNIGNNQVASYLGSITVTFA